MGLKLHHIDARGAHGELDGQPFQLSAADAGWRAEIGENGRTWTQDGAFSDTGRKAISEMRSLTYQVIALYRSFQRFGPTPA